MVCIRPPVTVGELLSFWRDFLRQTDRQPTEFRMNSRLPLNEKANYLLISGWACRVWLGEKGRQQIIDLLLPGDLISSMITTKHSVDVSLLMLTKVQLVPVEDVDRQVNEDVKNHPGPYQALAMATMAEHQRLLDHIIRLGAFTPSERLADLLSELYVRLLSVGLAEDGRFECPLSQGVFADALGLSVVHTNRMFMQLEREGVISRAGSWMTLHAMWPSSVSSGSKTKAGTRESPALQLLISDRHHICEIAS